MTLSVPVTIDSTSVVNLKRRAHIIVEKPGEDDVEWDVDPEGKCLALLLNFAAVEAAQDKGDWALFFRF